MFTDYWIFIFRRLSCTPTKVFANGNCPTGAVLPNPRLVSSTFHKDQDRPSESIDQLFTIFGQFVDHDLTLSSVSPSYAGINCCSAGAAADTKKCAPVTVTNDPFYSNKCLNFVRSLVFCEALGCTTDQTNSITAYIDGANIYGSDTDSATQLRSLSGGKLATSSALLMPVVSGAFKAGDSRATEHPALASMHTIFLREHNRIASLIKTAFPSATDEEIYQNARRIVVAEYQNVVFGEFLPLVIGSDSLFSPSTVSTSYDELVDASILNEFAAAAFRFGHTLLNGRFDRLEPSTGSLLDSYLLRFNFDNDGLYKQNPDWGMTAIIKGMTCQAAQSFDQFVTKEVTQFLFAKPTDSYLFGEDLVTRNIQRGRDHYLQPWLSYRSWCGCPTADDWNTRPADIDADKWSVLRTLYTKVSDIDLFTGGLAEKTVPGGAVGATFACIIRQQFKQLIFGDRYFFTHGGNVGARFNPTQISALKNVKMSDIICRTTSISEIQKYAFMVKQSNNPSMACSSAYNLDVNIFFGNFTSLVCETKCGSLKIISLFV